MGVPKDVFTAWRNDVCNELLVAEGLDKIGENNKERQEGQLIDMVMNDKTQTGSLPETGATDVMQKDGLGGAESTAAAATGPDDAPAESLAHVMCRYQGEDKNLVSFRHAFKDGEPKTSFQVTLNAVGGDMEEAYRICRLCFAKFEAGATKDEVMQYRTELYKMVAARVDAEDAPPESLAHAKCHYKGSQNLVMFEHVFKHGEPKARLQVTVNAVGGDIEEAYRICLLCFVKFEAGATKDEVLQYRDRLYKMVAARVNTTGEDDSAGVEVEAVADAEDAPPESLAHVKCRYRVDKDVVMFDHAFKDGEPKTRFQVTVAAAGGDMQEACRICRVCFARFEAGATKDEVLQYRTKLYAMVAARANTIGEDPEIVAMTRKRKIGNRKGNEASKRARKHRKNIEDNARISSSTSSSSSTFSDEANSAVTSDEGSSEEDDSGGGVEREVATVGTHRGLGLVAAKAAVRSGLRCPCHYLRVCPDR